MKFLSLQAVEIGAATNIKSAIENAVEEYLPGWKEKLVAIGSDGASVMRGRKGGVIALMRQDCPWLQVQITTPYICDGDNIFLPIRSQLQVQNTWSNTQYPFITEIIIHSIYVFGGFRQYFRIHAIMPFRI